MDEKPIKFETRLPGGLEVERIVSSPEEFAKVIKHLGMERERDDAFRHLQGIVKTGDKTEGYFVSAASHGTGKAGDVIAGMLIMYIRGTYIWRLLLIKAKPSPELLQALVDLTEEYGSKLLAGMAKGAATVQSGPTHVTKNQTHRTVAISVTNDVDDPTKIIETNFWKDNIRARFYVSVNAGCFRILLPKGQESAVGEMKTAREVIVSRGPWPQGGQSEAFEILFDDGSNRPFALHTPSEGVFGLLPKAGRDDLVAVVYLSGDQGEPVETLRLPARYRHAAQIPWGGPWKPENN